MSSGFFVVKGGAREFLGGGSYHEEVGGLTPTPANASLWQELMQGHVQLPVK